MSFESRTLSVFLFVLMPLLAGCESIRETLYGDRGIPEVIIDEQFEQAKKVDLIPLLDPQNVRATLFAKDVDENSLVTTDESKQKQSKPKSDVDRAILAFDHPRNYPGPDGNPLQNADACTQAPPVPTTTKATLQTTTRKVSRSTVTYDADGKEVERTADKVTLEEVDTQILTGPKLQVPKNPQVECALDAAIAKRRNTISQRILDASDVACHRYSEALLHFTGDTVFVSSMLAVGLGAAGSVVSGASQILSAAAGGTAAIGSAVSESYYSGQTLGAILKAIETERLEILNEKIVPGTKKNAADYTITEALRDANNYHYACTLRAGLEGVKTSVEDRLKKVKEAAGLGEKKDEKPASAGDENQS